MQQFATSEDNGECPDLGNDEGFHRLRLFKIVGDGFDGFENIEKKGV
jgi:hypothetical protein